MSQSSGSAASVGFEGPESLSSVDLEALQVIQDEFARQLRPGFSAMLSGDIAASVTGIRQDTYAGFQQDLTSSTYLRPIAVTPVQRASVLHLSPELIFPILELMMGGTLTTPVDPARQLTAIEEDVLEPLVQIVLRALSRSWKSLGEIEFSRGSDLPLPHETVIVATVELEISAEVKGSMSIALPSLLLRRIRARTEVQTLPVVTPTSQQADAILRLIQPATLEFEARLEGPKVGLRDLLNMKEGQIVLLDQAIEGRVNGLLNKSPYFRGQVVSDGKKRLLLIDSCREPEPA
jgi:flagellar motor switch protein FliM